MNNSPTEPSVSVLMTTYNGASFVKDQISSVLSQLDKTDELIIGDDCSSDNSVEIIKSIGDSRIKLFQNKRNSGLLSNFSRIIDMSRGRIIFLCDQDDIWLPDKVEICSEALETNDMVIHNALLIDERGNALNRTTFESHPPTRGYLKNLIHNGYIGACMAFRRELILPLLPFSENVPMHDWYIAQYFLRKRFKISIEEKKLIFYRRHANNLSQTGSSTNRISLSKKFRWRYDLLKKTLFLIQRV